jgi:hypothetical protein
MVSSRRSLCVQFLLKKINIYKKENYKNVCEEVTPNKHWQAERLLSTPECRSLIVHTCVLIKAWHSTWPDANPKLLPHIITIAVPENSIFGFFYSRISHALLI